MRGVSASILWKFERVLGIFAVASLLESVTQLLQKDCWAAGIFFLAVTGTGIIGHRLSQNKKRSPTELAQGVSPIPSDAQKRELSPEEADNLVQAATRLGWLWTFTILALCIHLRVVWWHIAISIVVAWVILAALMGLLRALSKVR
jgi:hypothetical protein